MEWIGKRIKARNKERLQVVNKRKKMEAKASVTSPAWKRKQRRQTDDDSDLEDITPASNDGLSAQVNLTQFASLRIGSEQNIFVKDSLSRVIRDLDVHKSAPSSSRLRDGSEQNLFAKKDQCSPEIRCLNVEKSVPSSSRLRDGSEQNMCVKGQCSPEVRCLNVEKSVPSSSRLRDGSEQNLYLKDKCSPEIRGLNVEKSVPSSAGTEENLCLKDKCSPEIRVLDVGKSVPEIEILSNSESENEERPSAKKKLFEENDCTVIESTSDEEDGTSETEEEEEDSSEDNNIKDDTVVNSLSSGDPSSSSSSCSSSSSLSFSSSDDEFNFKEVVGDTDDDTLRKARSPPVKKVSMAARKPLERYKRSGSSLTKPREEAKKIRKSNSREEEGRQNVVGIETNQPSNAVFTCAHCGKENKGISNSRASFIRQQALRDDIEAVNNFTVTNLLNYEDDVSINSGKTPETPSRPELKNPETRKEVEPPQKPSTSRPEMFSSEREKEVQAPEKPSTSIPEMFSSEKAKELQAPGKPSTSRPEIFSLEKAKEVPALDKPSTSRPEIFSLEKAKEVPALEKPSTSRPEIFSLEKEKEVQALDKPSTSRPEIFSLEKAKEVSAPGRPSRPEIQNSEKAKVVQTNNSVGSMIPALAEGLNKSVVTNEPIDYESDFSNSSADKSGDESEPEIRTTNNNAEWRMLNGNHKEVDLFRLLVNSVWEKGQLGEGGEEEGDKLVSSREEQYQELAKEDQRKYDDDGLLIIRPPPLVERFGVKEPQSPPEMSDSEIEEAKLWEELAFHSKSNDIGIELLSQLEKEIATDESPAARCRKGNHELYLDIEIGLKCIHCGFVERDIRSMDASEWGEKNISGRRKIDRYEEEENNSFSGKLGFDEVLNKNSLNGGCVSSEGTVWDKIPGVKSQMYPHQQEGFEFIWRNLAGTIVLNELKDFENSDETGGCIMSHAPGTGKTRLTIIFLQAYLECFPNCKPVIIAPASLLLTWAEEFKKWNISIPFHNLSSLEFTGKESSSALRLLMQKNSSARSTNEIRMVKIYSWMKSKSILGISYNLYEKLAGVKDEDKKTKTAREVKPDKELEDIREILMGIPGLLVLDEAHTPRNQRSCIWKTLSKVETQKRILLSGTPFQNNFQELCNVLGLARPKYLERLTSTLKKSGMTVTKRGKRALGNEINNRGIEELKAVMLPFVHVHKGSILQKSLPGLRECVVVLNPPELQKRVLESIEVTHNRKQKNVFETEHKLSLVSVHPSLVSRCKLTEKEKLSIDEALLAQLKKIRLDPNQSVKTRFLMEFIGLCEVIKEKVLVFSQYIDPLKLIMKHLVSRFNWNPGEEVLYMHGKIEQRQRQTLINEFNDPKSKAKVFLASTKACSEGISLVGASRVILLDVVWNPAVERQAISRAYRIGQQRIVYTYHLVAKGTPEGPKYCKQAQKDRISELVFACSSRPDKGKEKIAEAVTEDKVLDTMVQHSKLRDMFDNLIVQPKEADLVEGFSILMP